MNQLIKRLDKLALSNNKSGWIDEEQTEVRQRRVVAVQHGISRASFETWAKENQINPRVIQLILHHDVDKKLHSAYDRSKDLEGKAKVLQAWGDFCFSKIT